MAKQETAGQENNLPRPHVKAPPHSVEAEQAVLGGLMLESTAWDRVAGHISDADFYRSDHACIFRTIAALSRANQPLDILTVAEALKSSDQLDKAGGEAYLYSLANNTPSVANIKAYADIVRERSVLRQLLTSANEIADSVFTAEDKDSSVLLDDAERRIFKIANQTAREQGPQAITHVLTKTTDRIDELFRAGKAITGIPTGFADLDNMTAGLQPGDLVIIAARPSMGKTVLSMNIAEHTAITTSKPVLVFSLEMSAEAIAMRMLSSLGRINQHRIRSGQLTDEDWPRITSAVSMLSSASIFIDDTPALTPSEMRSRARRVAREHGELGLIVVDYLQLMRTGSKAENRTIEMSEISRSLKALARELNTPLIAASQLNRGLEQRHDKRPVMSDIRESGAIEQDADLIAFIYRDEVYNEQSPDKGVAEIIIGKQRNGPIGKVRLTFLGEFTRFENYTASAAPHAASHPHGMSSYASLNKLREDA